jgi:PAS domain S-box-containing protein
MQSSLAEPKSAFIPLPLPGREELDEEGDENTDVREELDAVKASLRILNLEDNASDAELNEAMLSTRWPHCELLRVETREDFVAALEQEDLDLVLSDYTMPGFNGLEALALARARRPEIPFLFVSGTIGEDTAIEALKSGATDYVLKHRLLRLIPAVDRALRETVERVERELAEEAMRQSEHKYRVLFESLGEAAFLVEEETGKVLDVNRRAGEILGYQRGQMMGCNQYDFLALGQNSVNSVKPAECALVCADGALIPVILHNTWLTLYGRQLVLRLCHETPKGASGAA